MVASLAEARSHNVIPEDFLRFYRDIRDCEKVKEASVAALARAKKAAKASGIDLDALKLLGNLTKLDEDEAEILLRHTREMAIWLDLPLGTQLGLFAPKSAGVPVAPVKHATKEKQKIWEAGSEGLRAGRDGDAASANPYPVGSPGHVEWAKQHTFGLTERATAASMGDTEDEHPADIAPATRRGRPPVARRGVKAQAALDKAARQGASLN